MPNNPPPAELGTHRDELPCFAGYLAAALQVINEHGTLDKRPSPQADHQVRTDYYDSYLRLLQGIKPMQTLAGVMAQRGTIALAIEDAVLELDTAGFNGKRALDKAIARGVLAKDSLGVVSFGIPSFHGHLIGLGR